MPQKLEFSTKAFRKMPNPYYLDENDGLKGPEMYFMICDVKDIPLNIPMKTNPREQKLTTAVAKKIKASLIDPSNRNFYLLNRGLLLSAESVAYNNKKDIVTVIFSDENVHGDVDGGHTYKIIKENMDKLERGQQYVKIEILTGIDEMFQQLAGARNTSTQVQDKSIAELEKRFDIIKNAIKDEPFKDNVYFKENEEGTIDVADILAILNMFNLDKYKGLNDFAITSYSGKKQCIDYYIKTHKEHGEALTNPYVRMKEIMPTIFKLYDKLEVKAGDYYQEKRANGKYGAVTGVVTKKEGNPLFKTKFLESKCRYVTPNAFLYPIIGAFRALIDDSGDYYTWKKDPMYVLDKLGPDMIFSIVEMSRELGNNPNATGKNKTIWKNLHMCVIMENLDQ
ncbi:MAG: AIPR family protein [Erysipelotrichaceae bacterium]|uniref:AIPR family protein n=1 Tax=Anaerorhabdus sp. TaxID=1872524 RepID=UPI002FC9B4CD